MSSRSSRAKRSQQTFSIVLSVIVVLSMALSLIVALNPSSIQPPAPTSAPVIVTPQDTPILPTATASPTPTPAVK